MALDSKGLPRSLKDLYDRVDALENPGGAGISAVTTPDGSDAGTTQTLANALKVKINEIITYLNG